jgi:hypothetical protein
VDTYFTLNVGSSISFTVSHREDRIVGKRDEFRCPLCQNLSNCLIPFIDVGVVDWIGFPSKGDTVPMDNSKAKSDDSGIAESMSCETIDVDCHLLLNVFLVSTPWWVSRHNKNIIWDGQCAYIDRSRDNDGNETDEENNTVDATPCRRNVRGL